MTAAQEKKPKPLSINTRAAVPSPVVQSSCKRSSFTEVSIHDTGTGWSEVSRSHARFRGCSDKGEDRASSRSPRCSGEPEPGPQVRSGIPLQRRIPLPTGRSDLATGHPRRAQAGQDVESTPNPDADPPIAGGFVFFYRVDYCLNILSEYVQTCNRV
jgi:hypothetical protein